MSAEANKHVFQRPRRAVAIRCDGDDFVVSLMPNDLVIFRNESADALRKLCKGLRWAGQDRCLDGASQVAASRPCDARASL